jgi:cardiolipin synthase
VKNEIEAGSARSRKARTMMALFLCLTALLALGFHLWGPLPKAGRAAWKPSPTASARSVGRFQLLMGGSEFWNSLQKDLSEARESVYVQTLSYEWDEAGQALSRGMETSPASDKRLIVDFFSRTTLSDRSLFSPRGMLDPGLRREARETEASVDRLRSSGVRVLYVDAPGWRFWRFPFRNHKKIVTLDDRIAYFGGINFSEHNFAWGDFMIRVEDPRAAAFLSRDFLGTWEGGARVDTLRLKDMDLYVSARGPSLFSAVGDMIDGAKREILLICPYVTAPFFERLGRARRRGVDVTIVTPEDNNRLFMRDSIREECRRSGIVLKWIPGGLRHEKALVIDRRILATGSANFDFLSYGLQPELLVVIRDRRFVEHFHDRCLQPLMAEWRDAPAGGGVRTGLARAAMRTAGWLLERFPR